MTIVKWGFYSSETRKSGFESESIALSRFAESQTLCNGVLCYGFLKTILLLVYCQISIASLWHTTRLNSNIRAKWDEYQFQKHWKKFRPISNCTYFTVLLLRIFTHVHTILINLLLEDKFGVYCHERSNFYCLSFLFSKLQQLLFCRHYEGQTWVITEPNWNNTEYLRI